MLLLEGYLIYIQERQWDDATENPDTFDVQLFKDLLGKRVGHDDFVKRRHMLQPSLYNIYIKNSLGDYKGRPDRANSITRRTIGYEKFKKDLPRLLKIIKFLKTAKGKEAIKSKFMGYGVSGEGDIPDSGDAGAESTGGDGGGGVGI